MLALDKPSDSWPLALAALASWHSKQDRKATEAALKFVESELRLRIPPAARRRWPAEQIDDAIQGFLLRLLKRPLPDHVDDHRAYILAMFRNWCIDVERGRRRDPAEPWEQELSPAAHPQCDAPARADIERVTTVLDRLSIEDRVAIKMTDAPELLTWDELSWLAVRAGLSAAEIRDRVLACPPVFQLTLLFDPGDEPIDTKARRDRMERFRKRRERARQRLHARLGESR